MLANGHGDVVVRPRPRRRGIVLLAPHDNPAKARVRFEAQQIAEPEVAGIALVIARNVVDRRVLLRHAVRLEVAFAVVLHIYHHARSARDAIGPLQPVVGAETLVVVVARAEVERVRAVAVVRGALVERRKEPLVRRSRAAGIYEGGIVRDFDHLPRGRINNQVARHRVYAPVVVTDILLRHKRIVHLGAVDERRSIRVRREHIVTVDVLVLFLAGATVPEHASVSIVHPDSLNRGGKRRAERDNVCRAVERAADVVVRP